MIRKNKLLLEADKNSSKRTKKKKKKEKKNPKIFFEKVSKNLNFYFTADRNLSNKCWLIQTNFKIGFSEMHKKAG